MNASRHRVLPARHCLLLLLLAYPFLPASSQTVVIDPPVTSPVEMLTINDLDFLNATTPKWLFTISIRSDAPVRAAMIVDITVMLADRSCCGGGPVFHIETEYFDVANTRIVTNIDLTNDNPGVVTDDVDEEAKQRLEDSALPGGRIPAGMYAFMITLVDENGGTLATTEFTFEPVNPSSLELFFPQDGEDNAEGFPIFQWRYDGPRSRISIYEKLPHQSTLEEVISGIPHLTEIVASNSFQYPASGARQLEPGKTYAWTIEGLAGISGGSDAVIRSEIRSFRLSTRNEVWVSGLLDEIEAALGSDYISVFEAIRSQDLAADGTMYLNGSPINYNDLLPLLEHFRNSPDDIGKVELE